MYEEITKPKTILSYNVVAGPALSVDLAKQRIFSITIRNAGKTPLDQIDVEISAVNSKIENLSVEKSLISSSISKGESSSRLRIQKLLPDEKVLISLLATSSAQNPEVSIVSRSSEVLGIEDSPEAQKGKFDTDLFGAALSATSVALMSLLLVGALRRRGLISSPYTRNKEDIIAFISGISRIDILESQFMQQNDITYVRFADTLYIIATEIDSSYKDQCVKCLKCLLICKIIDRSANVVRYHLRNLGFDMTDVEYKAITDKRKEFNSVTLRQEFIDIIK